MSGGAESVAPAGPALVGSEAGASGPSGPPEPEPDAGAARDAAAQARRTGSPAGAFALPSSSRERRFTLGAVLWLGGALLWAYVVLGQLVVDIPTLPESLAFTALISVYAVSWLGAARHATAAQRDRSWRPALLGVTAAALVVLVVTASLGPSAEAATTGVAVTGIGLHSAGRWLMPKAPKRSPGELAAAVAAWILTIGGTTLALAASWR